MSKFVENLRKMFTTGQWVFAALFFIAFVIAIYFSYGKDKALHQKFYKGSYKVLIGFLLFIVLLFIIKYVLKD
jgi:hypothetical protein